MAEKSLRSTTVRTVLICGILLATVFGLLYFMENSITRYADSFADEVQLGLMLFAMWLFVSTGLRTIHRRHERVPFHHLVFAGVLISIVAGLVYLLFLFVYGNIDRSSNGNEVMLTSAHIVLYGLVVGLVISLLTAINLKVVSRMLGNVIELAVILILGGILFYLSR